MQQETLRHQKNEAVKFLYLDEILLFKTECTYLQATSDADSSSLLTLHLV